MKDILYSTESMKKGFYFMSEYAEEEYNWESRPHVNINGEWIPMEDVQFENIEEDIQGRDMVTVIFNGERIKSLITLR
jgi:hypothetical protein